MLYLYIYSRLNSIKVIYLYLNLYITVKILYLESQLVFFGLKSEIFLFTRCPIMV